MPAQSASCLSGVPWPSGRHRCLSGSTFMRPYVIVSCREVLAVPLPRRPLFPGGFMPVTVSNEKLIQELIQLKKGGCAAACSSLPIRCPQSSAGQDADKDVDDSSVAT